MRIQGKIAVVTGAASGIGRAIVQELTEREARCVVGVDLSPAVNDLSQTAAHNGSNTLIRTYVGNVADETFRRRIFDEVQAEVGLPSICVPAAGITRDRLAARMDSQTGKAQLYPIEDFRQVLEINLTSPVYWGLELIGKVAEDRFRRKLKRWSAQEEIQGTIIFIGSVSSQGNAGQISYSAAKAGLEGVAGTLMKEAMYHGVRCMVIHPGFTDTPMVHALGEEYIQQRILPATQLGRLIRPQEIAQAVCFMIENPAVSGEVWADAGWHPSA